MAPWGIGDLNGLMGPKCRAPRNVESGLWFQIQFRGSKMLRTNLNDLRIAEQVE